MQNDVTRTGYHEFPSTVKCVRDQPMWYYADGPEEIRFNRNGITGFANLPKSPPNIQRLRGRMLCPWWDLIATGANPVPSVAAAKGILVASAGSCSLQL